jgi:hypothetical protein
MIKLSSIKPNPDNPRVIKDERFQRLKQSIQDFPKMMALRPMVIDDQGIILGGNMRLKALQDLGFKEVPREWVKQAAELTEEEKQRFIIADNVGYGDWQWDMLNSSWDVDQLAEWGMDIPKWSLGVDANNLDEDELDLSEEFDPIGASKGLQRIVFIFDNAEAAQSWIEHKPEKSKMVKRNMAWQVDLSTLYT